MRAGLNSELMAKAAALPATAVYRTSVESTCAHALSVLQSDASDADVEVALGLGQLEEQILAAKDELNLMDMMSDWKPWEGARRRCYPRPVCGRPGVVHAHAKLCAPAVRVGRR